MPSTNAFSLGQLSKPWARAMTSCASWRAKVDGSACAIVGVHFLRRVRISSAKGVEQFLGLPLELMEIGAVAKRTGRRRVAGHDELLFRRRQASAEGPVSAHSGRKEFIVSAEFGTAYQSGRSPSRGHGGALIAPREA